jgi:HAD superfamily hydrolase (TIGR01509 family)
MVHALIFDFNGVLADDDPIHMRALQQVAEEEGLSITETEYLDKYLPLNDWDCFRLLFETHARPLSPEKRNDLIQRKSVYYYKAISDMSVLFEGAATAVKSAAGRFKLAIASGARRDEILHILRQANLQPFFDAIVAAEDVTHGKPHPEPFARACVALNELYGSIEPAGCIAVEDSIGGIMSAHEAGMRCLGIAHSYSTDRLRTANPEWIIESIADFPQWLEQEISK